MSQLLDNIPGVVCQSDDCFISGETLEQHDERLLQVLQRLESAGITLNENKYVFAERSLTFLGNRIDEYGVRPCPEKVRAITEMATPTPKWKRKTYLCEHLLKQSIQCRGHTKQPSIVWP